MPKLYNQREQQSIQWPPNLEHAISEAWRVNKSGYKPVELANILRALQKLVGAFPDTAKQVTFSHEPGLSYNHHGNLIAIDPWYAANSGIPVNPHAFDILCGLTLHEITHSLAGSDNAIVSIGDGNADLVAGRITENSIAIIGEEIYVDNLVRRQRPKLYPYILKARYAYKPERKDVNWDDVLKAWMAIGIYGEPPNNNASIEVLSCLQVLLTLTQELRSKDLMPSQRKYLYEKAYQDLKGKLGPSTTPSFPQKNRKGRGYQPSGPSYPSQRGEHFDEDDIDPDSIPSADKGSEVVDRKKEGEGSVEEEGVGEGSIESGEGKEEELKEGEIPTTPLPNSHHPLSQKPPALPSRSSSISLPQHMATPLPELLQRAIREAIELEQEDLSSEVYSAIGREQSTPYTCIKSTQKQGETPTDYQLLPQLQYLQRLRHATGKQTIHGEPWGRVDQQNLHRAYTDGHPYKQIVRKLRQTKDVVLLLDASGSMSGESGRIVYSAAKAVFEVLRDQVHVYSYSEGDGNDLKLSKHSNGRSFSEVMIGNVTPSGLALTATLVLHPKSLLIHFTDGGSNHGPHPNQIFHELEKKYPEAMVVEINYRPTSRISDRDYSGLSRISGINLHDIADFPRQLREVLEPWFIIR